MHIYGIILKIKEKGSSWDQVLTICLVNGDIVIFYLVKLKTIVSKPKIQASTQVLKVSRNMACIVSEMLWYVWVQALIDWHRQICPFWLKLTLRYKDVESG